jgi:hypothetical protein
MARSSGSARTPRCRRSAATTGALRALAGRRSVAGLSPSCSGGSGRALFVTAAAQSAHPHAPRRSFSPSPTPRPRPSPPPPKPGSTATAWSTLRASRAAPRRTATAGSTPRACSRSAPRASRTASRCGAGAGAGGRGRGCAAWLQRSRSARGRLWIAHAVLPRCLLTQPTVRILNNSSSPFTPLPPAAGRLRGCVRPGPAAPQQGAPPPRPRRHVAGGAARAGVGRAHRGGAGAPGRGVRAWGADAACRRGRRGLLGGWVGEERAGRLAPLLASRSPLTPRRHTPPPPPPGPGHRQHRDGRARGAAAGAERGRPAVRAQVGGSLGGGRCWTVGALGGWAKQDMEGAGGRTTGQCE